MRTNLKLGSLLGIPVGLNYSWFLALALITAFFGLQIYPLMLPDEARALHWGLSFATAVAFFVSVLAHELAHGLSARAFGVPVNGITLFVFGGIAQFERDARRPSAEFVIAASGPLVSFILTGIFFGVWVALGSSDDTGSIIWEWLWLINLAVGLVNLTPAFPFDGARLIRAVFWGASGDFQEGSRLSSYAGQAVGYFLIAVGVISFIGPGWWPIDLDTLPELWLILIGLFLENSARNSHQQVRTSQFLATQSAGDLMTRGYEIVGRFATADELANTILADGPAGYAFVTDEDRVVGIVTAEAARAAAGNGAMEKRAEDLMVPAPEVQVALATDKLGDVVERMEAANATVLPVIEDGKLAGIITREQIDAALSGKD
jgi:Zn-dependent protease/CBS domain-containing protein